MRQFIASSELDKKGCLTVSGKDFRYLCTVLRVSEGDMIYVRLTDGALQPMTVAKVDSASKKVILQCAGEKNDTVHGVNEAPPPEKKCGPELWLFQFAAKPPKMDLIIRQAVECGVSFIVPVEGEFCQKGNVESARKKSGSEDNRWERIITEAREQSGSPVDTKVLECMNLESACALWKEKSKAQKTSAVVLYEQNADTVRISEAVSTDSERIAVAVGAEGGISPAEIEMLKRAGFSSVHFETNILRCETAAIVTNTLVMYEIGELSK